MLPAGCAIASVKNALSLFVSPPEQRSDLADRIRDVPLESVVAADGEVCERPPGQTNEVRSIQ